MAHITHRCDVCCSEMLAGASLPAPRVCLLCRLSAEEALEAADEDATYRTRMLYPARSSDRADRILRLS